MTIVDLLYSEIQDGLKGKNIGYSLGLPKLEDITDGLTRSTYTLLFAGSGIGKSSAMLFSYVYNPIIDHLLDGKLKIVLFSLEMKKTLVLAKLLSIYLFYKYNIQLSAKEILSRKKNFKLSDYQLNKINEGREWLKSVERILVIEDVGLTANKMYSRILYHLEENGVFTDKKNHTGYVPNNPEQTLFFITDHLNLLRAEEGRTKKQEIDLASNMIVSIRNRTDASFLVLMQSNRSSANVERLKLNFSEPRVEDIKDSAVPSEDAEIVLALYNPKRDKLASYRGYDMKKLDDKFRSILCLKNRYGESDVADCCYFDGKVGIFRELPKPEEINDYDNLFKEDLEIKQDIEEIEDKQTKDLKFIL